MSVGRVEQTRAVTTRLTERDPTKWKSVRERLRKMWQVGFRAGRNVGGPSRSDTGRNGPSKKLRPDQGGSQFARDFDGKWVSGTIEMSADRVDRTRAVTIGLAKRDPTYRQSVRERLRNICGRWVSERVEMSADRHDRTRADTTRLANHHRTNRKSVGERLRKIQEERYKRG